VKVKLVSASSGAGCLDVLKESAILGGSNHTLVDDSSIADIILFAENWECNFVLSAVRQHPDYKSFQEKCFCFCENDNIVPTVPGVYTCIPDRFFDSRYVRTGPYVWMMRKSEVEFSAATGNERFLYSFVGSSATSAVRKMIFSETASPRSLLIDTAAETKRIWWAGSPQEQLEYRLRYDRAIEESKFVLCPRGEACSSIRFFETMRAGRVPVLISDRYVLPEGPRWSGFILRIPESSIASIPEILKTFEDEAVERGRLAKLAWDTFFSSRVLFDYVVGLCNGIQLQLTRMARIEAGIRWRRQLLSPSYLRNYQRLLRTRWGLARSQ